MWEFLMPPVKTGASPRLIKIVARHPVGSKKRRTFLCRFKWDDDTRSWESSKALDEDLVYQEFLRLHPEYLHSLCSINFRKLMRGSRSTAGASETHSTYISATRASRTSSPPPPSQASMSNAIDVDEMNHHGDAASTSVASTSTQPSRSRSVVSAPAQPSRPMVPTSAQPSYSGSPYSSSSKGKGDKGGGKGASSNLERVSPRGAFAGIAPSGRVIVSGGTTG